MSAEINYGNDQRSEIFERIFWCDLDRGHSAFQAFVDCCTPIGSDTTIRDQWLSFRAGWNAAWSVPARVPK